MSHLIRSLVPATLCLSLIGASAMAQGHGPTPKRGTEGLAPVVFDVANTGEVELSCTAKLAHWYSLELGRAAHGVSLSATFWSNPETGEFFLLNPIGDQMPVERLWCGVSGRSWETRFEMPLARTVGQSETDLIFDCAAQPKGAVPEDVTETRCTTR
ncbi:hypothetical protein [Celeribacter sp. PS-C1]|uniref:hypothetical protein n=1 Tax=Celeribacter sp. PS-C1 TaxID=2820813 RepID=UPI001CA5A755|nr:hypothetical protein [Celeribacter sp. PS-C1]MBW6417627.1 hypothetical protein [Celeribacter sp. PS-C1]